MLSTLFQPISLKSKLESLFSSPDNMQALAAAFNFDVDKAIALATKAKGFMQLGKSVDAEKIGPDDLTLAAHALGFKLPVELAQAIVKRIPDYVEPGTSLTDFVVGGGLLRMLVDASNPEASHSGTTVVGRCPNCDELVFEDAMKTHKCPHCKEIIL